MRSPFRTPKNIRYAPASLCAALVPLALSAFGAVLAPHADPLRMLATAHAQSQPPVDGAALDRELASARAGLASACGRPLRLKVEVESFVSHPPKPSDRTGASPSAPQISSERLVSYGSNFASYVQDLCQKDKALAGRITSLVMRSYDEVADGNLDSSPIYIEQLSVGHRYIFRGKAGLQRGHTVYLFESGTLTAYCDLDEGCTDTDLRGVPGIGVGAGTAINSDDGPRGGSKDGGGCVSVDGEQICGKGSLGFAAAVERGDCTQAKSPRIAVACRQRLAAVKSFRAEGCAIAEPHAAVVKAGGSFGGHTPNDFFVSLLKRIQGCNDAEQLRSVLDDRWLPDHKTLRIGGEGHEDETELHQKIRKSVVAACSTLRPKISEKRLIGLLYHCAAAAGGSLASYSWPTAKADQARLREAQTARIDADRRGDAARHADFDRRKDLPMAASYCRSAGKKMAHCFQSCRKNYTCR